MTAQSHSPPASPEQARNTQVAASSTMKPAANLVQFLTASPTPYHAVHNCVLRLEAAGFTRLAERSEWDIKPSGRYYVTRNQSSLIAFTVPTSFKAGVPHPVAIVGTHTDSCNFKLRPVSKRKPAGGNYLAVGVETYGGGLWHTWLDRDLSVAGRVITASQDGKYVPHLVHIKKPLVRIPTVAIHLDRTQNDAMKYNQETSMQAILGLVTDQTNASSADAKNKDALDISANHHPRLLELIVEELASTGVKGVSGGKIAVSDIHDFELSLVDNQDPCLGGANDEFVFSARLDNLFSTFCAAEGLADSEPTKDTINLFAAYDNEEIGSVSAHGAESNFLEAIIHRVSGEPRMFNQAIANSFLLSCDMGHAVHPAPDHVSKHQSEHKPMMNHGPAIKTNAKIRYTSLAPTTFLLRRIAEKASVPLQEFVARNDMPCGSTIGPLQSKLGLRAVDIGCVQLSMHSIRETAGAEDVGMLVDLFKGFFKHFAEVDASLKMDD